MAAAVHGPPGIGQPQGVGEAAVGVLAVRTAGRGVLHDPILLTFARVARRLPVRIDARMAQSSDSRGSVASATDPIAASPVYPAGSRVNESGHLEVAGCDVVDLASEHGTPAYIYAEDDMRSRAAEYVRAFSERTNDFEVIYASKAFPCTAAYELFREEGLSVDVASGGELHAALRAGFDPERVHL